MQRNNTVLPDVNHPSNCCRETLLFISGKDAQDYLPLSLDCLCQFASPQGTERSIGLKAGTLPVVQEVLTGLGPSGLWFPKARAELCCPLAALHGLLTVPSLNEDA